MRPDTLGFGNKSIFCFNKGASNRSHESRKLDQYLKDKPFSKLG